MCGILFTDWLFVGNLLSTSGSARNAPLLVPSVVFAKTRLAPKNPDARTHTKPIRLGRAAASRAAERGETFRKRQRARKRTLFEDRK